MLGTTVLTIWNMSRQAKTIYMPGVTVLKQDKLVAASQFLDGSWNLTFGLHLHRGGRPLDALASRNQAFRDVAEDCKNKLVVMNSNGLLLRNFLFFLASSGVILYLALEQHRPQFNI